MAKQNEKTDMWKSILQTALVAAVVYYLLPYLPLPSFGKK